MNYINNLPSQYSQANSKKEIKTSFMPKIKRAPLDKKFNNKLSSNLTKYLFDFFSYKELLEIGKINIFFMNNIIDYFEENGQWPEKIYKLKLKYNFDIHQNEVDCSLKKTPN